MHFFLHWILVMCAARIPPACTRGGGVQTYCEIPPGSSPGCALELSTARRLSSQPPPADDTSLHVRVAAWPPCGAGRTRACLAACRHIAKFLRIKHCLILRHSGTAAHDIASDIIIAVQLVAGAISPPSPRTRGPSTHHACAALSASAAHTKRARASHCPAARVPECPPRAVAPQQ